MNIKLDKDYQILQLLRMPNNWVALTLINLMMRLSVVFVKTIKGIKKQKQKIFVRDNQRIQTTVYQPKEGITNPNIILYFPGGGFIMPGTSIHHRYTQRLALKLQCQVIVIDYRLAPKYVYPTAHHDALDATLYFMNQYPDAKIILMGDSAGGNIVASVCHVLRKRNGKQVDGQMLFYPGVATLYGTNARHQFTHAPMFSSRNLDRVYKLYFNDTETTDAIAAPLDDKDFSSLPPTYIETAEYDPLTEDGLLYHQKLMKFKVDSTLIETKGTPHGYDGIPKAKTTQYCHQQRILWLEMQGFTKNT